MRDGAAQHAVHVAVPGELAGVRVVRDEHREARALTQQGRERPEVARAAPVADHQPLPGQQARAALLHRDGLVVAVDARRGVRADESVRQARAVPVEHAAPRGLQDPPHGRIAGQQGRQDHDLTEAEDAGPREPRAHFLRAERHGARLVRAGGHARRAAHQDPQAARAARREHPLQPGQPEDVHDLVRFAHDGGGAVRHDGLREAARREGAALDVDVRVDEARHEVLPARVELLAAPEASDAREAALRDGDVARHDLPGLHEHHPRAAHHQVGGLQPLGDTDDPLTTLHLGVLHTRF